MGDSLTLRMATRDLKTLRTKENEYLALSCTHNHNSRIKILGKKTTNGRIKILWGKRKEDLALSCTHSHNSRIKILWEKK
jgi:hypothetical protein